jgi:acyl transferase domain-containing protein
VTLAFENEHIPPTIGVKEFNFELKLEERNVDVVTELRPWPKNMRRRAGVNSFGYGGANAHAILEPATSHVPWDYENRRTMAKISRKTWLLPFSAHNHESLQSRVEDLATARLDCTLADLALTLGSRRSKLPSRGFTLVKQDTLQEDICAENLQIGKVGMQYPTLPLAFVFTGQGAQWPEMGRQLMEEFPTYRRTIQLLDSCLASLPEPPEWSLEGTLMSYSFDAKLVSNVNFYQ